VTSPLTLPHRVYPDSVLWRVLPLGVVLEGEDEPFRTAGRPKTCRRIVDAWRSELDAASGEFAVPLELLIMTAATEGRGAWLAVRTEPGYVSPEETPHLISAGLCQTLLSTAREVLGWPSLPLRQLQVPEVSLRAAAAYISRARDETYLDPVIVAADYNAGRVRHAPHEGNRWRLHCWRPEDGEHLERAARWYGDACAVCR